MDQAPGEAAIGEDGQAGPRAGRSAGRWLQQAVPTGSLALFAVSLVMPAMTVRRLDLEEPPSTYWGLALAGLGWLAVFTAGLKAVWFANPVLWLGLALAAGRRWRAAAAALVVATGLASVMFTTREYYVPPFDSPPEFHYAIDLGPGFVPWYGAFVVGLVGSVAGVVLDRPRRQPPAPPQV